MPLLCDRPHVSTLILSDARLVVSKTCGLNAGGRKYEMGDELEKGVLSETALRQIYEPPLSLVETVEFGIQIPALREACLRRGVSLEQPELKTEVEEPEATEMCPECGTFYKPPASENHTDKQCRTERKRRARTQR